MPSNTDATRMDNFMEDIVALAAQLAIPVVISSSVCPAYVYEERNVMSVSFFAADKSVSQPLKNLCQWSVCGAW